MAGKLVFFFLVLSCACAYSLELKQVLALSRHNLRSPLTSTLAKMTPKQWPKWDTEVGELTRKGAMLESNMGKYFSAWLKKEALLPDKCPDADTVFVYANTRQRTKATATAFTEAAFPDCNIAVNFKNMTGMDPIFNPVITNSTDSYKQMVIQEMQDKLNRINLTDAYLELNAITDIANSEICKENGFCDLAKDEDEIVYEIGMEPNVSGPFFISNAIVDSFLMSFYEGMPLTDIGWGQIKNESQWKVLTKIVRENQNVRFNLKTAARDIAQPLLKFLKERIESDTKFTLLVGHDSNLSPIITCMGFKPYKLPEQFELTPIGGKLVFQKWTDGDNDFLKVEFVYQSRQQLRDAKDLSLSHPPNIITMRLNKCITDDDGFCPWSEFEKLLNDLTD